MICLKCGFDNSEHIRFCGMCGTRINEPFSSTETVISNIWQTTPFSDDQPNPAMCGFIDKGASDGVYSPCEDASSSEQRLSAMDDAEERERSDGRFPEEEERSQEEYEWTINKPVFSLLSPSPRRTSQIVASFARKVRTCHP